MASWSTRRRYGYFFAFVVALGAVVGLPAFFTFYDAPTCDDGRQNGGERGVDCGGSCKRLCPADFSAPRILWSHSTRVVPGVYNALAYAQNPNQSVESASLSYLFKLYDGRGLLVAERKGRTFVPAGQRFAVFEGGIDVGERVPVRTTFEFTGAPEWRPGAILSDLRVLDIEVEEGAAPKAEARIRNVAPDRPYSDVSAFIIIYDRNDNRLAFSRTVVDSIGPEESREIFFTWPEAFAASSTRSEVVFVDVPDR